MYSFLTDHEVHQKPLNKYELDFLYFDQFKFSKNKKTTKY